MLSPLIFLSTLVAFVLSRATLPDPLFVTYWGQSAESSLLTYCQLGYFNVINLAFAPKFGTNPLTFESQGCSSSNGYSGCAGLASDISACQSLGIKILVSMGGATVYDCGSQGCTGNYSFTSVAMAQTTGTQIWQTFFNNGQTTSGVARPFGSVSLDGIDLDIEMTKAANGQATQMYYDSFVGKLLSYDSNLIVGGAPECMEGDLGVNTMASIVTTVPLDFMFVQFFNNPYCAIQGQGFQGYLGYWAGVAKANPNGNTKMLIGVPGDASAGASLSSSYFTPASQLLSLVAATRAQYPGSHVGVGVYDAATAYGSTDPNSDPQWAAKVHAGLTGGTVAAAASVSAAPANIATASGSATSVPSSTGVVSTGMASIGGNTTVLLLPTMATASKTSTTSSMSASSTSNITVKATPTSAASKLQSVPATLALLVGVWFGF